MWHASAAPLLGHLPIRDLCASWAHRALGGVGDSTIEWHDWSGRAYHLRRRLTAVEAERVGPVVDVRDDELEVERRLRPYRSILGPDYRE